MIKIVAVDDEEHALERFERMVGHFEEVELCGLFSEGKELLDFLMTEKIDAVFLDIQMPEVSGLDLAEKILNLDETIEIIFVTAFSQYATEAFEVNALDYLLKPITEVRISKTVDRLKKRRLIVDTAKKPYVQCFGEFEVFVDGTIMLWKNSKAKEILAYLVHKRGIPQNWEKISAALWPEFDGERAHTNFHATTYLLRKNLQQMGIGRILECKRGNYRVLVQKIDCDFFKFEHITEKILKFGYRDELFNKAELLYRGTYMDEAGYEWAYPRAAEIEHIFHRLERMKM